MNGNVLDLNSICKTSPVDAASISYLAGVVAKKLPRGLISAEQPCLSAIRSDQQVGQGPEPPKCKGALTALFSLSTPPCFPSVQPMRLQAVHSMLEKQPAAHPRVRYWMSLLAAGVPNQ